MLCCLLEAAGLEADFSCSCRMKSTSPLCSRVAIQNLLGSNERNHINFMLVLLLYKDMSSRLRHKSCPDCRGKSVSNSPGKQGMEDLIKYNFYEHFFYFRVLLVAWHCVCSNPCSGWVTDIELHVPLRAMSRAPGSQLEEIWQTLTSGPISSISLVAHVGSQHCALHLTLLLNYNPTRLLYNINLIVITRETPAAGTEKPLQAGKQGTQRDCAVPILEGFQTYLDKALNNLVWP